MSEVKIRKPAMVGGLEHTLIVWFNSLDHAKQDIVSRLVVNIYRHARPLEQSDHYLIERGSHYLGAMFQCSPDRANKEYLPHLERIMGLIRAMRLDPRDEKDRVRILSMVGDLRPGWMATYWRLTDRAIQALYSLGEHAWTLGHAVPSYHLGSPVRLKISHTLNRVRWAICPVVPDHGPKLRLSPGGRAHCFKCETAVGRWEALSRNRGFRLLPFSDAGVEKIK